MEIDYTLFKTANLEFSNHLQTIENKRILFSGRFGSGKTTFIKWFFNQPEIKEKYNVIHLFPINYSVASNKDIFQYIKMDILIYLLQNENVKIENIQLNSTEVLSYFASQNIPELFTTALSAFVATHADQLSSINPEAAVSVFSLINKLGKKLVSFKEGLNREISDLKQLREFMEQWVKTEGSIFEFNFISGLIAEFLAQCTVNGAKHNILIIDDLDRIDPNHIFRILNVFAAHFDHQTNSESDNKFGFDKILVVSDVNNLRNIYQHRYGFNVDFSGYIDKFYSLNTFHFNNTSEVIKIITERLGEFKYRIDYHEFAAAQNYRHVSLFTLLGSEMIDELSLLLISFFTIGQVNLRSLEFKDIIIVDKSLRIPGRKNWTNRVILKIECLEKIVGGIQKLLLCLDRANKILPKSAIAISSQKLLGECLPLFNDTEIDPRQFYSIRINEFFVNYKVVKDNHFFVAKEIQIKNEMGADVINESMGPSIFEIYIECIKKLQNLGYFSH